jgi:hypothetical protein
MEVRFQGSPEEVINKQREANHGADQTPKRSFGFPNQFHQS